MMRGMKALLGICIFVVAALVVLSTFSSGPPSSTALQSLVTQTHHQLNQLHKLKEELEGDQPLDNSILTDIGFVDNPILYPNHSWFNVSTPVIVSAVASRHIDLVPQLIRVAQMLSFNSSIFIYALDLYEEEMKVIDNECNDTCSIITFDFSHYPTHVRDLRLNAYRPIIIQEMLQRAGIVFWLDPCMRLLEQSPSSYGSFLDQWVRATLKGGGVLVWQLDAPTPHLPTSALTHPDMFPAFRTYKRNYDFQQMSDPRAIVLVNTAIIHRRVMKPWVRCVLTPSCLSPVGAQDTGCKYNKRPMFRYSGCHLYDASAFNVALGLAFGMDDTSYLRTTNAFACRSAKQEKRVTDAPTYREEGEVQIQSSAGSVTSKSHHKRSLRGRDADYKKPLRRRRFVSLQERAKRRARRNKGRSRDKNTQD